MGKGKFKAVLKGIASFAAITAVAVGLSACGNKSGNQDSATSGQVTFINNHTDWQHDGTWKKIIAKFNKKYPNIKVNIQTLTDYEGGIKTRMNSKNYGDVLLMSNSIQPKDRPHYFVDMGSEKLLSKKYYGLANSSYDGKVYGLPTQMDAQGMVVNWKVFQKAGVKKYPKTPEEFISDLKAIKSKEKGVIPLYTNYAATWALTNWDGVKIGASGDPEYINKEMKDKTPYAKGKTLNTLMKTLYTISKDKLIEKDPTTSDWEQSKQDMADGKIGCMVLGSWAISQIQAKNKKNANDIKFLAFPMTAKNGQQYASWGPDYALAISRYSKYPKASRTFINWLVDDSDYAQIGGGIPSRKGRPFPAAVQSLKTAHVKLIQQAPAPKGEEGLMAAVQNDAQIGDQNGTLEQNVIDSALGNNKQSFDQIMNNLNKKWGAAVEKNVKK